MTPLVGRMPPGSWITGFGICRRSGLYRKKNVVYNRGCAANDAGATENCNVYKAAKDGLRVPQGAIKGMAAGICSHAPRVFTTAKERLTNGLQL